MRRSLHFAAVFFLVILAVSPAAAIQRFDFAPGREACALEAPYSDLQRTTLEFSLNSFRLDEVQIEGRQYSVVELDRRPVWKQRGYPALPTVRQSILIPEAAEMAVRVIDLEYQDIPGIDVAPSKGPLLRSIDPAQVPYEFADFYGQDAWFPRQVANLGRPYILRDVRGIVVEINPFQFNPTSHTLRVYTRVTVEVTAIGPGKVNVLDRKPASPVAPFEQIYARHFLNYDAGRDRYAPIAEFGPMLVITHDAFHTQVQPLVDWKNQMGIPTTLVDVSTIGSTAAELKAHIQGLYDTEGLTFILLIGDENEIPYLTNAGSAADPMYGLLAGDDSYPEAFVGRISAENPDQVITQVERSIEYERDPQPGGDWYHKACGIASDDSQGGPMDWERMEIMRDLMLTFTYTEMDQIYDPGATPAQVTAAVNEGRSVIQYLGHGGPQGWGTTGFVNSDVNALGNDNMLPWIISVACNTGQFTGFTCFAEAWLRATNGTEPTGSIGMYASTVGMQWDPPVTAQFEIIDLLINEKRSTFGGLCFNGSCQMIDEWGAAGETEFKNWTIFGDPSLRVRTDLPTALSVSHAGVVVPELPTFTVQTEPGVLVGLSDGGVYHGSALADGAGLAEVTIVGTLPLDEVTLTVTGFNKTPWIETVPVAPDQAATCDVAPAAFSPTLQPGHQTTDWLHISNNGEPGSTLYYQLVVQEPGSPLPGGPDRDLTGSTVTAAPDEYDPGATMDIVITAHNNSPDEEWIWHVELDFPIGVVVEAATDMHGPAGSLPFTGSTGNGATVVWEDSPSGNIIPNGETGTATVTLTFAGVSGDVAVPFSLVGDEWGSPPHTVDGTLVLHEAGPRVTVLSPNGGESWPIGEEQQITFSAVNGPEFVDIELDRGGPGGWELLAEDVPVTAGSLAWTVLGPPSTTCTIRITDAADPAVTDISDAEFTIFQSLNWVQLGAASGSVPAGETDDVSVTFDATYLPEGTYEAEIVVLNSAGDPVVVPVTLEVQPVSAVAAAPTALSLGRNHPNPFNPRTTIRFALPAAGRARLSVYDVTGRRVRTLVDSELSAGDHEVVFDGADARGRSLASGVYFYELDVVGKVLTGKMILLR